MKIEIKNYNGIADCKSQLLTSREAYNFSTILKSGTIYLFIGEINSGNWGLVSAIGGLGRKPISKKRDIDGKIFLDDIEIEAKDLEKITCFAGEKSTNKTIEQQLKLHLSKNNEFKYDDLQKTFDLSQSRIDRKFDYIGYEKWFASLAIGVASNKKIFCYPYITEDIKPLTIIKKHLDFLVKSDKLILIPANDKMIKYFDEKEIEYEKIFYTEKLKELMLEEQKKWGFID